MSATHWCVCLLPMRRGAGEVLFDGSDFVSYPRLSPDGRRLAFITWNHPNMPWDGTELKVAELTRDGLESAGASLPAARPSPCSSRSGTDDGTLYFISDRSGFWNLYAASRGGRAADMAARR